jgi:hypothetical protein
MRLSREILADVYGLLTFQRGGSHQPCCHAAPDQKGGNGLVPRSDAVRSTQVGTASSTKADPARMGPPSSPKDVTAAALACESQLG